MEGSGQTKPQTSLLEQAQQALSSAEWEEREKRQQLSAIEAYEQQLCLGLRAATQKASAGPDSIEVRKQLNELSRKREDFARQKAHQREVLRGAADRVHSARKTYQELQHRVLELQNTSRREERTVAQWQRQIKDTEGELARLERTLAEAQARLEQVRREHARLAGPYWKTS